MVAKSLLFCLDQFLKLTSQEVSCAECAIQFVDRALRRVYSTPLINSGALATFIRFSLIMSPSTIDKIFENYTFFEDATEI